MAQNGRQHKGCCMGIQAIDLRSLILAGIFKKIRSTIFNWCLLVYCVVIFPIRCDLSDFLYPEFISTNKLKGVKTRDKGNRLNRNGSGK